MTFTLVTTEKNAMLDGTRVNANNGFIKIYAGTVPADANAALGSPTLLGTVALAATAFPAASAGSITLNATTRDESADNSGNASFFRLVRSDGTTTWGQGTVTATGGGGDMTMPSVSVVAGQPIEITSLTITL